MTTWTPSTLVRTDDPYDRARASDGRSRLGAYLDQHLDRFHEYDAPDTPLSAEEFAMAVWDVATAPVMSPGYVRTRPDLGHVRLAPADDGSGLVARVGVLLHHSALKSRLPFAWRDWEPYRYHPEHDERYDGLTAPDNDRPAVLITAEVSAPLPGRLYTPMDTRGPGLIEDAKQAVRLLVEQINAHAGPMVATVQGEAVSAR